MSQTRNTLQSLRKWRPDVILAVAVAAVFIASVFAPRGGSAVLLLPLNNHGGKAALEWAFAHNARVIGRSVIGGIVLDHAPEQTFVKALEAGVLAISVPAAACISPPRSNR